MTIRSAAREGLERAIWTHGTACRATPAASEVLPPAYGRSTGRRSLSRTPATNPPTRRSRTTPPATQGHAAPDPRSGGALAPAIVVRAHSGFPELPMTFGPRGERTDTEPLMWSPHSTKDKGAFAATLPFTVEKSASNTAPFPTEIPPSTVA